MNISTYRTQSTGHPAITAFELGCEHSLEHLLKSVGWSKKRTKTTIARRKPR